MRYPLTPFSFHVTHSNFRRLRRRLDSAASNPIISARTVCVFKSVSLNVAEASADSLHQLCLLQTLSLQIPQDTHSDTWVVQAPQSQNKFSCSDGGAEGMESAHQLLLNMENNFISLFQLLLLKDRDIWAVPTPQPHFAGIKPPPWVCQLWAMERRSLGSTTTTSAAEFERCAIAKLLFCSFRIVTFSCSKSRLSSKVMSFHSAGAQCIFAAFCRQTGDLLPVPHASWAPASLELETIYWHTQTLHSPGNEDADQCFSLLCNPRMDKLLSIIFFLLFFLFFLFSLFPSFCPPFRFFLLLLFCNRLFFRSQNHFMHWFFL